MLRVYTVLEAEWSGQKFMVLKYIVNEILKWSWNVVWWMTVFDGLGMLWKIVYWCFASFCKLLRVGHHLKIYSSLALGLQGHCWWYLLCGPGWWSSCEPLVKCFPGRFLCCLAALRSIAANLKLACRHFPWCALRRIFRTGVGGYYEGKLVAQLQQKCFWRGQWNFCFYRVCFSVVLARLLLLWWEVHL